MERVSCNLCGADSFNVLWTEGRYRIVECLECGLRYLNPRPAQDELEGLYSPRYFREYYVKHQARRVAYFRGRIPTIERVVERGRLLDVGCGPGYFLHVAREAGWSVKGVDPSPFAVEYARGQFGLDVLQGRLDEYIAGAPFDLVSMWDVIAHVPDPLGYVRLACKMVRPGGVVVIQSPYRRRVVFSTAGMLSRVLRSRGLLHVPGQLYQFTPETLEEMLRRSGLRPLGAEMVREVGLPFRWGDSPRLLVANMARRTMAALGWYQTVVVYGRRE